MRAALIVLALMAVAADAPPADEAADPPIEKVTENGPIKATVKVEPASPLLGDPVTLTLTVEAENGVSFEMPGFGEALGRFSILGFTPRDDQSGSKRVSSQKYVLDPPMSGRQRIPPLRIEYLDERPGQDATQVKELLTDEIAIDVRSVVTDSELTSELRPARGSLSAQLRPRTLSDYLPWIGGGSLLVFGVVGLFLWRRNRVPIEHIDPYGVADRRLRQLESRGLPDPDDADPWYVELSAIVRQYIENRYRIRAPELTTEEFLRAASDHESLTAAHRETLSAFLARCDAVKFAGLRPSQDESEDVLATARVFVDETRPRAEQEAAA